MKTIKTKLSEFGTGYHTIIPKSIVEELKLRPGATLELEIKSFSNPTERYTILKCPKCKFILTPNDNEEDIFDCPLCGAELLTSEVEEEDEHIILDETKEWEKEV